MFQIITSENKGSNYETYNVCSDEAITIPDLATLVKNNLESKFFILFLNISNPNLFYYIYDVIQARRIDLLIDSNLNKIILATVKYHVSL